MFAEERRSLILNLLQEDKRLTVKALAKSLSVSEATLRTDLNLLEEEGLLTRTHGGAVINNDENIKNSFSERELKNIENKKTITNKARMLIKSENSILLDASTTGLELARKLKDMDIRLTIVTNGLQTAIELKENPKFNVILLGGIVRMGSMALEGYLGKEILDKINIDIMFTSASGFTVEEGLTDFNVYEVDLKRLMVEKANKVVALLDHTKIGKSSIASFAETRKIDTLITDRDLSNEMLDSLKSYNLEVIS